MLSHDELILWPQRLRLFGAAQSLIDRVRSSDPALHVGGGRRNASGRYPSREMGVSIQFESHRVELAAIHEMEHDPLTLEFYYQPPPILLDYNSARGSGWLFVKLRIFLFSARTVQVGRSGRRKKISTGSLSITRTATPRLPFQRNF